MSENDLDKVFKAQERLRNITSEGTFFEALGFQYYGPIDGHNVELLIEKFSEYKLN